MLRGAEVIAQHFHYCVADTFCLIVITIGHNLISLRVGTGRQVQRFPSGDEVKLCKTLLEVE